MNPVNQVININSFFFPGGSVGRLLPRSMEFGSTRCTFTDGLQYLIHKGGNVVKLFDMSDGRNTYRLRLEDGQWTLIKVVPEA